MKDVYCVNLLDKPKSTIYELYMAITSLYAIKLTHYCGKSIEGKIFSGRLGPKGLQKIQKEEYENNKDIQFYDLVSSKVRNHLFDMSNTISCTHYKNGSQVIIIVEEHCANDIDLESLLTVFIHEKVMNAYCFKYERELLPDSIFLGVYANPIGVKKKRTKAENQLINLFSELRHEDPMLMPQIFPKMYLEITNSAKLENICRELGYKTKQFGKGNIIITNNNMRVSIYDRENKLLDFLAENNIVKKFES